MKRIITTLVIMLSITSISFGQTKEEIAKWENDKIKWQKISIPNFDNVNREVINIGDYAFNRYVKITERVSEKRNHGSITYVHTYDKKEDGAYEEMAILKNHIERNKAYYEEKYKCVIESIYYWEYYGSESLQIDVVYPDWEEEYDRQQSELKKAKDTAREKRLESINW